MTRVLFAGRRVTGFTNAEETQVGLADKAASSLPLARRLVEVLG